MLRASMPIAMLAAQFTQSCLSVWLPWPLTATHWLRVQKRQLRVQQGILAAQVMRGSQLEPHHHRPQRQKPGMLLHKPLMACSYDGMIVPVSRGMFIYRMSRGNPFHAQDLKAAVKHDGHHAAHFPPSLGCDNQPSAVVDAEDH